MSPADELLIERWKSASDADAFAEIVARHATMVYATSLRITRNRADAEDVAQECFLALARGASRVKSSLPGWLHTLATRRSLDVLRSSKRRTARESVQIESRGTVASTEASWSDIQSHVDEAIAALPRKLRDPVIAHFLEGQSYQALGNALGLSRSTVASRVQRALVLIRRSLAKRGVRVTTSSLCALIAANASSGALPPALAAALGKLAIAGGESTAVVAAAAPVMVKKAAAVAVAAVAVIVGVWIVVERSLQSDVAPERPIRLAAPQSPGENVETPAGGGASLTPGRPSSHARPSAAGGASPEQAAAPTPGGGVVMGRVYDVKTGAGIEGIRAHAFPQDGGPGEGNGLRSDVDGRYRVADLEVGWYNITLGRVPGYPRQLYRRILVNVLADAPVEGIDFSVRPGIRVTGVITNADGEPVAAANIGGLLDGETHAEHATSGEDGRFAMAFLPEGGVLHTVKGLSLKARTDDHESETLGPLQLPEEGLDGLQLSLTEAKTARVAGVVVAPEGRPMEDVGIHLDRGKVGYLVWSGNDRTDSDGRFSIDRLAAVEYGIILSAPGVSTWSKRGEVTRVHLREGEERTDLRLVFGQDKPGLVISGRVTDTAGTPIPLAQVTASGPVTESVHAGIDGAFRITGLREGKYHLSTFYHDANANNRRFSPSRLPDIPAGTQGLDVVLHGQAGIEGRAERADTGEPITEFELFYVNHAAAAFSERLLMNRREVSDREGRFSLPDLYAGDATITVRAPGLAPAFRSLSLVEHETVEDVVLVLEPASFLEGSVVSAAGTPVADVLIFAGRVPMTDVEEKSVARSDVDGRFSVDSLPADTTVLTALHPEHAPASARAVTGSVIVLPEPGKLRGKVTRAGRPLAGVQLHGAYLDNAFLKPVGAVTASDGSYELSGLAPGKVMLVAMLAHRGDRLQRRAQAESGVVAVADFTCEPCTAELRGTVTIDGAPAASARLRLSIASADHEALLTRSADAEGAFHFQELPAGEARLTVSARASDGQECARRVTLALPAGEVSRFEANFSGQGHVAGRIAGADDSHAGRVFLIDGEVRTPATPDLEFLTLLRQQTLLQTEWKNDGSFEFGHLDAGAYTVVAMRAPAGTQDPGALRLASRLVTIASDESVAVELDLR